MTDNELVTLTLEAYAGSWESEDHILSELCSAGVAPLLAERLAVLVPLAFGRVLIVHIEEDVHFAMSAVLTAQDGSSKSCDLKTDTIFRTALEMATTMFHEGPQHLFKGAASISAEVRVVSQFLDEGIPLPGALFIEPQFLRISFEEWISAGGEIGSTTERYE